MTNRAKIILLNDRLSDEIRRLLQWEFFPVAVLLVINLIVGLITNHYGIGWDDIPFIFPYGENSLSSYRTLILDRSGDFYCSYLVSKDCYYGPAYFVLVTLISKLALKGNSALLIPDIWHAMNFIVFNIGVFSLYVLSRLWLTKWASFSAVLLFAIQPLLRGHGFINLKDMPFMVFFLSSVTAGLVMAESFTKIKSPNMGSVNYMHSWEDIKLSLDLTINPKRRVFFTGLMFLVFFFMLVIILLPFLKSIVGALVEFFYEASPGTWAGVFFAYVAPNAGSIPATHYVEKSMKVLARGSLFSALLAMALTMCILIFWSKASISRMLVSFRDQIFEILKKKEIWIAGLILGFTTAIRVLGPFAGIIVSIYMMFRLRKRSLSLILPYILISSLFIYIFWPFLWKSPFENFLKTIILMSDNPSAVKVLFNGVFYSSLDLPAVYLPTLIVIQITESVIVLACVGLIYLLKRVKQEQSGLLLLLFALWFMAPLAGVMIFRPALYDNFRQFLFIVPPLFLIAGMGLEFIFKYVKKTTYRTLFMVVLIIPVLYANVQLYPFEYVYYNSFVGGTKGAFRRFEMDYWLTAYREAAEYIRANEKSGAQIMNLPVEMSTFVTNLGLYEDSCDERPLYAVVTSRWNGDKTEYETAPIIYSIERDDAVMMVIRELPCPPPAP